MRGRRRGRDLPRRDPNVLPPGKRFDTIGIHILRDFAHGKLHIFGKHHARLVAGACVLDGHEHDHRSA